MQITLFRALKSLSIDDEQATAVVERLDEHIESAVNGNIRAVEGRLGAMQGDIKALEGSLEGKLNGVQAAVDALRGQMNFISVMMGVIGLAIAAGPIIARFIR